VRLQLGDRREAEHEPVDRVDARPRPGRVRALAVELDAHLEVPETACVEDAVGRLEHDRETGVRDEAGFEQRRQRALLERHLLAREEEIPPWHTGPREVEHHRDAALHVACAEPMDGAVLDAARKVALCRDGVDVAREHDRRRRIAPEHDLTVVVERLTGKHAPDEVEDGRLVTALRRHVDELERQAGEI